MSRCYVGNLPNDATEEDLEHLFKGYGRISECSVKSGYGFVELCDERDAEDAVHELDNRDFLGSKIRVEIARGKRHEREDRFRRSPPPPRGGGGGRFPSSYGPKPGDGFQILVKNLSTRSTWQDVKDYFRDSVGGNLVYATAHKEKLGEGIVEYGSREDMERAIEALDETDLQGRRIQLVPRNSARSSSRRSGGGRSVSRSPPPSRSRGGGRDRSRSPPPQRMDRSRHSRSDSR